VTTTVYTDGACLGNPGPGGWAWAVPDDRYASGAEARSTNQRMEIAAVLAATRALQGPLEVVSDSTYVVNCWRDRWWDEWLRRGWVNSRRKPVANRDLWEPLIAEFRGGRIRMRWVKGHGTDPVNDLVDRLAVEAANTQEGRSGTGLPPDLGAADRPRVPVVRAGPSESPLIGTPLMVTGQRPPELGGYDDNPIADALRRHLTEILQAKREMIPDLVVLSGLGLGAEQIGAEAATAAGIPLVAVLAYPEFDSAWPERSRSKYRGILSGASRRVVLQQAKPSSKQGAGAALARRDAWLADHADEAVVVWDGEDSRVGKLVRTLRDRMGEEAVWIVDPAEVAPHA
jgi:ribonuclease HI/uncharacterized phage-like protein YoqJ